MSSDVERRLETMFAEAPEPEPGAGEEGLHRALRALHPIVAPRRGLRVGILAFAAAVVLLAVAAGALATAGALHVSFGAKKKQHLATTRLTRPRGAHGIAAIVDGRLAVVTRSGFGIEGFPASAAALSPHALYVAAGIGNSLVALKPDGHQVWSHPAGGKVVAAAWAPDALRIAYVVHAGRRFVLHVIWGTGTHDKTIDGSVRPIRPSWRADNLALAYVGAGGRPIVYDIGHRTHAVLATAVPVTHLAFAPAGKALLLATPGAAFLGGKMVASGEIEAIGWFHGHAAAALEEGVTPTLVRTFGPAGRPLEAFRVPGRVLGITAGLVVTQAQNRILAGWRTKTVNTLLTLKPGSPVEDVAIG